jgi:hypothetical protein
MSFWPYRSPDTIVIVANSVRQYLSQHFATIRPETAYDGGNNPACNGYSLDREFADDETDSRLLERREGTRMDRCDYQPELEASYLLREATAYAAALVAQTLRADYNHHQRTTT